MTARRLIAFDTLALEAGLLIQDRLGALADRLEVDTLAVVTRLRGALAGRTLATHGSAGGGTAVSCLAQRAASFSWAAAAHGSHGHSLLRRCRR